MASGGLSVLTLGTTEMLLSSAERLDTHHLVSRGFELGPLKVLHKGTSNCNAQTV